MNSNRRKGSSFFLTQKLELAVAVYPPKLSLAKTRESSIFVSGGNGGGGSMKRGKEERS